VPDGGPATTASTDAVTEVTGPGYDTRLTKGDEIDLLRRLRDRGQVVWARTTRWRLASVGRLLTATAVGVHSGLRPKP